MSDQPIRYVTPSGDVILLPAAPHVTPAAPLDPYVPPIQAAINDLRARLDTLQTAGGVSPETVRDLVAALLRSTDLTIVYDRTHGALTLTLPPIVGQPGPQGAQGAAGPAGPPGPKGDTGATGAAGRGISAITQSGNTITATLTDATTQGPFVLGTTGGLNRGTWAPSTAYAVNDVVLHSGAMYYAKTAFTSGSSFDSANWTAWPGQLGGGGGSAAPALTLTSTGGSYPVTETFSDDPVVSGAVQKVNGSGTLAYDAANARLLFTGGDAAPFWAYTKAKRVAVLDYTAEVTLLTDAIGYQHLGLAVQADDSTSIMTGYRIAHLNNTGTPKWLVSRWSGGTERAALVDTDAAGAWPVGTTRTLRVRIDNATGEGTFWVDGAQTLTWTDTSFAAGRPGGFVYGATGAFDSLALGSGGVQITGLPAGYTARGTGAITTSTGGPVLIAPGRVEITNAQGAVLAAAYVQAGHSWQFA